MNIPPSQSPRSVWPLGVLPYPGSGAGGAGDGYKGVYNHAARAP